jgi:hypothetical protein
MAQDICDVLHRGAVPQQSTCNTVAEDMRIGTNPAASRKSGDHCVFGDAALDGNIVGRLMTDKYGVVARRWPLVL